MSPILVSPKDVLEKIEMRTASNGRDRMAVAADIATAQHGVAAAWQLSVAGVEPWWIARAVTSGYLHPSADAIYSVGHRALSRRGRAVAAVLHAGPGSVVSHTSAARLWEMVGTASDGPIHVSLARRRGLRSTDEVVIHRPRTLPNEDITIHRGLPVTTPERTLRDALRTSTVAEVTRMLEQLITVHGRSPDELHAWAHGLKGVRGLHVLHRALDEVVGPAVLRSELESRFRTLCQNAGLPMPETNVRIAGWEFDVAWLDRKVLLELDSWKWHGGHWQFHRDRRKGLAASRAGFELLRVTWPQVKYESTEVVETLSIVLARALVRSAV